MTPVVGARHRVWGWAGCTALLALFHTLALWGALWGTHTPWMQDTWFFILPYKAQAGRALAQGAWPWVSTALLGGQPLWAHPSAEVADPTTLLFAVLDPAQALAWSTWVHGVLTGLGFCACARALHIRFPVAGALGLAWVACGPVFTGWAIKAVPTVALPWLCLGALLARSHPARATAVTVLSSMVALMHPDPPALLSAHAVAAALLLAHGPRRLRTRALVHHGAAVVLGSFMAAPWLWPMQDVVAESIRVVQDAWDARTTLGARWVDLLGPGAFGVPGAGGVTLGLARGLPRTAFVTGLFAGSLWWTQAALRARQGRVDRTLWALGVALLVLAHGDLLPGAEHVWSLARARFPEKVLMPAYFCVLLATARRWQHGRMVVGRALATAAAALVVAGLACAGGVRWAESIHPAFAQAAVARLAAHVQLGVSLALVGLVVLVLIKRHRGAVLLAMAAVEGALTVMVFGTLAPRHAWLEGPALVGPQGSVASGTPNQPGVVSPTLSEPGDSDWAAVALNVRRHTWMSGVLMGRSYPVGLDAGGFETLRQRQMLQALAAVPPEAALRALATWGVTHLVTLETPHPGVPFTAVQDHGQTVFDLHVGGADMPRAWTRAEHVPGVEDAVAALAAGLPVVTQGPALLGDPSLPPPRVEQTDPHSITVASAADALLVLPLAYRQAWRVTVDGADVEPDVVQGWQLGVRVPPGSHRVQWSWSTRRTLQGCALGGVAACVALWRVRTVRRRGL